MSKQEWIEKTIIIVNEGHLSLRSACNQIWDVSRAQAIEDAKACIPNGFFVSRLEILANLEALKK